MGFFSEALPTAAAGYALYDQYDSLNQTKQDSKQTLGEVEASINSNTQFQPYGITGNMGSTQSTAEGVTNTLNPTGQGIQDQMLGLGRSELAGSTGSIEDRQNEVYGRMQQSMAPEQQRQQMMMQQQAQAQGRGGMTSAMYGGTSEQLAYQKALQEQSSSNWLGAGTLAGQEQMNQFARGQGLMNEGYRPGEQMSKYTDQNIQMNQVNNAMNNERAGMLAQMGMGGLTTMTNLENLKGKALADFAQSQSANLGAAGQYLDKATGAVMKGAEGLWGKAMTYWNGEEG